MPESIVDDQECRFLSVELIKKRVSTHECKLSII